MKINEIINSFIILDKSYNPPNRFDEKEIEKILDNTYLNYKLMVLKLIKRLIWIVVILLQFY